MSLHPCTKRLAATAAGALLAASAAAAQYDVAAYVWPAYQPEPRWAELDIFPEGIGEWQNVKEAVPKWKGHVQPLKPLWGYENEADPAVVAKKIDAAVAHGVNVFIYDWYWYGHRPFLESALDDGFLGAPNNGRMRFFIMWANHHVNKLWDNRAADKRWSSPTWRGWVSQEEFKELTWRWIEKYFRRGNYYRIGGRPVLMIYELKTFVDGVGGLANAMESVAYLRDACRAAGLGGVHLMACDFGVKQEWVRALGVESASIYNFVHWASPSGYPEYSAWAERAAQRFVHAKAQLGVQCYFSHASVGWDTNPRYPVGSVQPTVLGSSPEKFEVALRRAKDWCDRNTPPGWPHVVTINSWNEWTEGSYLEPDEQFGYGYLEAVRRVFGPGSPPAAVPGIVTVESLIDETLDREAVTRMPVPAYARSHWGGTAGASGARRALTNSAGRVEYIVAEASGPGAVVGGWCDGTGFEKARLYVDGSERPVVEGWASSVLCGRPPSAPLRDEALFVPIPFARSFRATVEASDIGEFKYGIEARVYACGTKVESASRTVLDRVARAVAYAKSVLPARPGGHIEKSLVFDGRLEPQASRTLRFGGPGAVKNISAKAVFAEGATGPVTAAGAFDAVEVTIRFDGHETVRAPLSALFAPAGLPSERFRSWYALSGGDGYMESFWVMPFSNSCEVVLANRSSVMVDISRSQVAVDRYAFEPGRSMYFAVSSSPVASGPVRVAGVASAGGPAGAPIFCGRNLDAALFTSFAASDLGEFSQFVPRRVGTTVFNYFLP